MNPAMLLCLVGTTAGVINMVPWGGTTARAAAVSGLDATELWLGLLPVQLVGLVCMLLVATVLGSRAQRRRPMSLGAAASVDLASLSRSDVRRVGKEGVSTVRYRGGRDT